MKMVLRISGMMLALLVVGSAWGMKEPRASDPQGKHILVLNYYNEPVALAVVRRALVDTVVQDYGIVPARSVILVSNVFGKEKANHLRWYKKSSKAALLGGNIGSKYLMLKPHSETKEEAQFGQNNYFIIGIRSTEQEKERGEKNIEEFTVFVAREEMPDGWQKLEKMAKETLDQKGELSRGQLEERKKLFDEQLGKVLAQVNKKPKKIESKMLDYFFYSKEDIEREKKQKEAMLKTSKEQRELQKEQEKLLREIDLQEAREREISERAKKEEEKYQRQAEKVRQRLERTRKEKKELLKKAREERTKKEEELDLVRAEKELMLEFARKEQEELLEQSRQELERSRQEKEEMQQQLKTLAERSQKQEVLEGELMEGSEEESSSSPESTPSLSDEGDLLPPPDIDEVSLSATKSISLAPAGSSGSQGQVESQQSQKVDIQAGIKSARMLRGEIVQLEGSLKEWAEGRMSREDFSAIWEKHEPPFGELYVRYIKEPSAKTYLSGLRKIVGSSSFARFKTVEEIAQIQQAFPQQSVTAVSSRPVVVAMLPRVTLLEKYRVTPAKIDNQKVLDEVQSEICKEIKPAVAWEERYPDFMNDCQKMFELLCRYMKSSRIDASSALKLDELRRYETTRFTANVVGIEQFNFYQNLIDQHEKLLKVVLHEKEVARQERVQEKGGAKVLTGSVKIPTQEKDDSGQTAEEALREIKLSQKAFELLVELQGKLISLHRQNASGEEFKKAWALHVHPSESLARLIPGPLEEGPLYRRFAGIRRYKARLENIIEAELTLNRLEQLLADRHRNGDSNQVALQVEWDKNTRERLDKRAGEYYLKFGGLSLYQNRRSMIMNSELFKKYLGNKEG